VKNMAEFNRVINLKNFLEKLKARGQRNFSLEISRKIIVKLSTLLYFILLSTSIRTKLNLQFSLKIILQNNIYTMSQK